MFLALFMVLSIGVLLLWQYASRSTQNAIRIQNALDNLSIAMDALVSNIEFSHTITLRTNSQHVLSSIHLTGLNPQNRQHTYEFTFNQNAATSSAGYKTLRLGLQRYAYGIETIRIVNESNRRLDITITSVCLCRTACTRANLDLDLCPSRIIITGSANVLHKHVTHIRN